MYRFAFLAAVIAQANGAKEVKPEDFIGKPPWEKARSNDLASYIETAKAKGIRGPWAPNQ